MLFRSKLLPPSSGCPACLLKVDFSHFDCKGRRSYCAESCCSWVVPGEGDAASGSAVKSILHPVTTSMAVANETQWFQSITHFALIFPPSCFKSLLSSSRPPKTVRLTSTEFLVWTSTKRPSSYCPSPLYSFSMPLLIFTSFLSPFCFFSIINFPFFPVSLYASTYIFLS